LKFSDPNGELALVPMLNDIISGDFIGSSFGFSVAASDLNNDGLDDLIVGAPQYYQYGNDGKYGGAVYVYINNETNFFRFASRNMLNTRLCFAGLPLKRAYIYITKQCRKPYSFKYVQFTCVGTICDVELTPCIFV